ncbi:MAG: T9SS C-terminal target domain-containing protein [Flavobacterium sp.]|nr:MAG: T9SS C-terminal target domain-containing protein [Flavobacterium sp.]
MTSNVSWTSTSSQPWLTLTGGSGTNNGTISATAANNTATGIRTAPVTVSGSGITQIVNITQSGAGASLVANPTSLNYGSASSSQNIGITSNVSWTSTSSQPWLTLTSPNGTNNGTISATTTANTATGIRTAQVTITGGSLTQIVNVTQTGAAVSLVANPTSLTFPSMSSSQTISVTSNLNWSVSGMPAWLSASVSSGTNNGTVNFTTQTNTATGIRIANITIQSFSPSIIQNLTITQTGISINATASATSLFFSNSGNSQVVSITSNSNWSITGLPSWLSIQPISVGSGNATITLTAALNTSINSFTGLLSLITSNSNNSILVSQSGSAPSLVLNTNSLNYASISMSQTITITSNLDWTITGIPNWLTVNATSGTGNAVLTLTTQSNNLTTSRLASLSIQSLTHPITQNLSISQSGSAPLTSFSVPDLMFPSTGGSQNIDVNSNTTWFFSNIPVGISVNPSSGSGNVSVLISTQVNTTSSPLIQTLTLSDGTNTISLPITIAGASPILSINPTNLTFPSTISSQLLTIVSNLDWTVTGLPTWLSANATNGTGNAVVSLTAQSNTLTSPRTATITIQSLNHSIIQNLSISQTGAILNTTPGTVCPTIATLNLDRDSLDFTTGNSQFLVRVTHTIDFTIAQSSSILSISTASGVSTNPCERATLITVRVPRLNNQSTHFITVGGMGIDKVIYVKTDAINPTSIEQSNAQFQALKISPNPVESGANIQFNKNISFIIYDLIGNEVGKAINTNQYQIPNLKPGVYFIKSNTNEIRKLVVE